MPNRIALLRIAFVLTGLSLLSAGAQTPVPPADYTPTLTFDIASIRETSGVSGGGGLRVGVKSPPHSSEFAVTNFTTKSLLQLAYGFGTPISGGPDWLTELYFNVTAKSDPSVDDQLAKMTNDQAKLEKQHMLQALLADRFHLKCHMETRESNVFALELAKGGSKMHKVEIDPASPAPSSQGNDLQAHGGPQGLEFVAKSFSPTAIAGALTSQLEMPVIDRTGLTGYYDFTLQFGREWSARNPDGWPDLTTAVQDQLGLKLERTRAAVPVLIIDHIDKPTAN